jgi:hypothetical protein
MLSLERKLDQATIELPVCRCGAELQLLKVKACGDTEVRIFSCRSCHHEFQLMVWRALES